MPLQQYRVREDSFQDFPPFAGSGAPFWTGYTGVDSEARGVVRVGRLVGPR